MLEKFEILDSFRQSENGKIAFYALLAFLAGILVGIIIAPKTLLSNNKLFTGNANGSGNGSGCNNTAASPHFTDSFSQFENAKKEN